MSEKTRTPAEIEREIEEERGALSRSLDALQESLLPENLISAATTSIRNNSGDVVKSVRNAARDNPTAFAIAGAGLTMLFAGIGAKRVYDGRTKEAQDNSNAGYASPSEGTAPGFREDPAGNFEERVAKADAQIRHRDYASRSVARDYEGVWEKVRSTARDAYGAAREGVHSADLRARLSEGTENMSDAARERVMRARAKVISAQEQLEEKAKKGGDDIMSFAKDEPLLAGALVLAAGALVGALLPRSSVENEHLGSHRDALLSRADDIFREETAKLKAVGRAALAEGRAVADDRVKSAYDSAESAVDSVAADAEEVLDVAQEGYAEAKSKVQDSIAKAKENTPTGEDAVEAVESEIRSAANQVAEAAKDEARKQKLGGSV